MPPPDIAAAVLALSRPGKSGNLRRFSTWRHRSVAWNFGPLIDLGGTEVVRPSRPAIALACLFLGGQVAAEDDEVTPRLCQ